MVDQQQENFNNSATRIDRLIRFCLENKLIVFLLVLILLGWGIMVAPFDWDMGELPRDPVPVDAIPDIGENQQIVFTAWPGRSPQDIDDQITYPLTASLLGMPGVKTVRSLSILGFSSIYVIFEDEVEFYWSRTRVLEKINSLPAGALPDGVVPLLGPDATALGQVFWYTLQGQDQQGNLTGGWDLQELRTVQDWQVRLALMGVQGVSEVASVGGFVQEYQIDVDPDAMRAADIKLDEVVNAVRMSNLDVGARTIEVNKVEYLIRGLGFIKKLSDIENAVVKVNDNVPLYVKDVAYVTKGPALRRGVLDLEGTEAVGGVVVVRFGENPLATIKRVKEKIAQITPGLPKRTLPDGTVSQVKIVPFYDRTGLIYQTLQTLNTALTEEILVTVIVVMLMLMHLRSALLISAGLPLAVLMCFIAMKMFKVDANIVALSGIAIAIGTMVDMGIIICENIVKHLERADPEHSRLEVVYRAAREVGGAVFTAVATTIVGFLPVFTMEAAEGKLFKPLAFTKTFALFASVIVALTVIPPAALLLFGRGRRNRLISYFGRGILILIGVIIAVTWLWWAGLILILIGLYQIVETWIPLFIRKFLPYVTTGIAVVFVGVLLSRHWLPLGPEKGLTRNFVFVAVMIGGLLLFFQLFYRLYPYILRWCLAHKIAFMFIPVLIVLLGAMIWLGFDRFWGWLPPRIRLSPPVSYLAHKLPGLGKEFMPALDEGSFLYMPTTGLHASIGESYDALQKQDVAISNIPEVEQVVGKIGRVDSPLDPAPISMVETIINYQPKYIADEKGRRLTFRFNKDEYDYFRSVEGDPLPAPDGKAYLVRGRFERDEQNRLIPDPHGQPFRRWRPRLDPKINPDRSAWPGINEPYDIWQTIEKTARMPGSTSAPVLQPIETRIIMLQSGMRGKMGIKIKGPDLESIEKVALQIELLLKDQTQAPMIEPEAVIADRIVGKPYLEIDIDRQAIARYGIKLQMVQDVIETAIGGKPISTVLVGRQRYPIRVRYLRELRDNIEALERILIPAPQGAQIPLIQLAQINYLRGPQVIKSEDASLIGYVFFNGKPGYAEGDVVNQARAYLDRMIQSGTLEIPAGVSKPIFAGSFENQVRAEKKLLLILPLTLLIIFVILYLRFGSIATTLMVFSGIAVAWAGGFIMIWLYAQDWFLNFAVFGTPLRELFQVQSYNLSVAVWVGFLALFGIASDDGVVIAAYLEQTFKKRKPATKSEIRHAVLEAGRRRARPCLMTTATTILALIPVLTSTGRGSDIMVPMAIPTFGGMSIAVITMFIVPTLYCAKAEAAGAFSKKPTYTNNAS